MMRSVDVQTRETADDVTASEAASYAYCARAWHLEYVLGKRPSRGASAVREAGSSAHLEHGERLVAFDRRVRRLLVASLVLIAAGIALLVAAFVGAGH